MEICFECVYKLKAMMDEVYCGWSIFSDFELNNVNSPIYFKDKKHAFEDCSKLKLDQELEATTKTTEWHICKYSITSGELVCQRIYDNKEEYCSKHNKQCQKCGTRDKVREVNNNEFYCSAHANQCKGCQVRKWVNSEGYCSEHENECKYLTCETRSNKEYCAQHTYSCYVNDGYPFKWYSFSCSERVAESHRYCANHYWVCKNFRCHNRISCSKSLCEACQTTDLCLNDCRTRIAKYTTYCERCREKDQLKDLVKSRTNISGTIEKVERFTTWWANENIATIITINGDSYWVFLGLIDRKPNAYGRVENNEIFVYPTNPHESKWGIYPRKQHNSLTSAQSEAFWLQKKLNSDNPILVIHSSANNYVSFDSIVREPYVIKEQIGDVSKVSDFPFPLIYSGAIPHNLNNCFKPLDIVKVKCVFGDGLPIKRFYHYGIILDNNYICDFTRREQKYGVKKVTWKEFLENTTGVIFRIHHIIPFKHYQTIIRQAVWAKDNNFWRNNYNLVQRNCAHVTGMLGWGINYSEEVWDRRQELAPITWRGAEAVASSAGITTSVLLAPFTCGLSLLGTIPSTVAYIDAYENKYDRLNNGKDESIKLTVEIEETNRILNTKQDWETKKLEEQYKAQIEQPVNIKDCIIM